MYGSHFALKNELVIGIDDDGLEFRVCRHQAQVAFVYGEKEEKENPPKSPPLCSVLTAY